MSINDQEHFKKLSTLLPTEGKWRWVAVFLAVPSLIGSLTALGGGVIWIVSYSVGLNYAVKRAPVHDSLLNGIAKEVPLIRDGDNEIRDTFNHHGYSFRPLQ